MVQEHLGCFYQVLVSSATSTQYCSDVSYWDYILDKLLRSFTQYFLLVSKENIHWIPKSGTWWEHRLQRNPIHLTRGGAQSPSMSYDMTISSASAASATESINT